MRSDEIRDLTGTIIGSLMGAFFIFAYFGIMATVIYEIGIISGFIAGRLAPRWLEALRYAGLPRVRVEWA